MGKIEKNTAQKQEYLEGNPRSTVVRWLCRAVIFILILVGLYVYNGYAHLNRIFAGPSATAKLQTLEKLSQNSQTAWIPGIFLSYEEIAELRGSGPYQEYTEKTDNSYIPMEQEMYQGTPDDEWADWPDGIQIRKIGGATYQAYAILIRDPSRVYLGLSNKELDPSLKGKTISEIMEEQGAVVAINAAEINRINALGKEDGSEPLGQVISENRIAWDEGIPRNKGFVGIDDENVLRVSAKAPKIEKIVKEMEIRDGCSTGPLLVSNGQIDERYLKRFNSAGPRSAIGQREDGTIIFLCMDGWQPSSIGGTVLDLARLMKELEAKNACALEGGNSALMMYRDTAGKFGTANDIYMVNSHAPLQSELDPMPTYWLVQSVKEG